MDLHEFADTDNDEDTVVDQIKDLTVSMQHKTSTERKSDWSSMFELIHEDFSPEQKRTIIVAFVPLLSEEMGEKTSAFGVLYLLLADETLNFSGEEINQILLCLESALTTVKFGGEVTGAKSDVFLCTKEMVSKYMKDLGIHRCSIIRMFVQTCFNQVEEFDEVRGWLRDTVDKSELNDDSYRKLEDFEQRCGMIIVYLAMLACFDWDLKFGVHVESTIIRLVRVLCDGNTYFKGDWLTHNQSTASFQLLTGFLLGGLQFELLHDCCAKFVADLASFVTENGGYLIGLPHDLRNYLKSKQSAEVRGSLRVVKRISEICKGREGVKELKDLVEFLIPDAFRMFRTDALAAETLDLMLRCKPNSVANRRPRVKLIKKLAAWIGGVGDAPIGDIAMELNQISLKQNLHLIMKALLDFERSDPEHDPNFLEEMQALLP